MKKPKGQKDWQSFPREDLYEYPPYDTAGNEEEAYLAEDYGEDYDPAYQPYQPAEGWEDAPVEADDYAEAYDPAEAYDDEYAETYDEGDEPEVSPEMTEEAMEEHLDEEEEIPHPRSIFKPNTHKPPFVLSVAVNVVRVLVLLVVLAGLAGLGAVVGIAKGYMETAPRLDLAAVESQAQTSFIYDSNGNLITEYKGTENRVMVSLQAMPVYLRQAFIACEDGRFYTHNGVDVKRIVGAFMSNLSSSSTQGGSTITQQLVKNTLLSPEQSYKRKIQEAYLAMQLETAYTKDEILESYLNTIFLGENYYGVQVAAMGYFGKSLEELTLRECAMLAGVTNSPYYYNPRRNFYTRAKEGVDYVAITNNRTDYVLRCMYEDQFITREQYEEALNPDTAHVLEKAPSTGTGMYAHAHYVEYAVEEVIDIFLQQEGLEDTPANRASMEHKLRTGGYRVVLAIDPTIQEAVENTLANWTRYPSLRDPADKVYRSSNGDGTYTEIIQPQAAAVVLDYHTGEIKAIVGSRTTPTAMKTLNRATDMKMPVGSAIKPIAVYAPALELGASPASVVYNMPLPISGWKDSKGNDTWPKNYGGGGYKGPETLRAAMTSSHNTAAAQTLMTMVGVERSVDFLHRLGVDDNHIDATPFGLSLGSSGITPMQMTVAYGVLANGGVYQEPISVLGISDSNGNVIWDGHAAENQERRRVFSVSTSWMIVDMLKSVVSSGTGTSAKIKGQTVGGKTGTNSDQKGVFFAGMTGYYASSVWVGHDNYKALSSKSTGSGAAAPLWQAYMAKIHNGLPNREILEGDPTQYGLVKVTTCVVSGQLATEACYADEKGYGTVTDWWAQGKTPQVPCQMHRVQNVCAQSGMAASGYCSQVVQKGVVVIPNGHPLQRFLGTKYEETLTQYLGGSAVARLDATGNTVGGVCTLHTSHSTGGGDPVVENTLIPDAKLLLTQAYAMMSGMDATSAHYQAISSAAYNLESVINSGTPSQSTVAGAMGALTQAMAGLY